PEPVEGALRRLLLRSQTEVAELRASVAEGAVTALRLLDDGEGAALALERADVVGRAGRPRLATLVGRQRRVAGIERLAAGQQRVRPGRAAVIRQRAEPRVLPGDGARSGEAGGAIA